MTGESWSKCREYFKIIKVTVDPVAIKHNETISEPEQVVKSFKCGYCGAPTCERGFVLSREFSNKLNVDWSKAELTDGECCTS